jgi:hypothetical protein
LGDDGAVAMHGSQDVTRGQAAGSGSADARGTGGQSGAVLRSCLVSPCSVPNRGFNPEGIAQ